MTFTSEGNLRYLSPISRQSRSYPLPTDREVVIGRDQGCEIVIDSSQYDRVSRRHAAIRPLDPTTATNEWMIYDLNSANGTFINGQRLQGGQVLRGGDHFILSDNGPEFIFEYRQNTLAVASPNENTARNSVGASKFRIKSFRVERDSRQLVIHCQGSLQRSDFVPTVGCWTCGTGCSALFAMPGFLFLLGGLGSRDLGGILFGVGWILLFATPSFLLGFFNFVTQFGATTYTFDACKREFVIMKQSFLDKLFHKYLSSEYPLDDLTAVRLVRSKYENEETKYDTYDIYLDQVPGEPINLLGLSNKLRNDLETAQQLVDIVDEYLASV